MAEQYQLDNLRRSLTTLKNSYENEAAEIQSFLDSLDAVEDLSGFEGSLIGSNVSRLVTGTFNTSNKVGAAHSAISAAIQLGA